MFESMLKASYLHGLHQERSADLLDILPFEYMRDLGAGYSTLSPTAQYDAFDIFRFPWKPPA